MTSISVRIISTVTRISVRIIYTVTHISVRIIYTVTRISVRIIYTVTRISVRIIYTVTRISVRIIDYAKYYCDRQNTRKLVYCIIVSMYKCIMSFIYLATVRHLNYIVILLRIDQLHLTTGELANNMKRSTQHHVT